MDTIVRLLLIFVNLFFSLLWIDYATSLISEDISLWLFFLISISFIFLFFLFSLQIVQFLKYLKNK